MAWDHFIPNVLDTAGPSLLIRHLKGGRTMTRARCAVEILRTEYMRRHGKNASYSLRTFARFLGLPPGRLSEVLAKKRRLTLPMGEKIADRLLLHPTQKRDFLAGIGPQGSESSPSTDDTSYFQLESEIFTAVADWQHFAILSLMETSDFSPAPAKIARRLGITSVEARDALERLERLGLAERQGNKLRPTHRSLTTSHDVPSAALRRGNAQHLDMAKQCLEDIATEARDITSITMAIDVGKLPEAKAAIRRFRRSLARILENGERTEVYGLNVQLFPLSKRRLGR